MARVPTPCETLRERPSPSAEASPPRPWALGQPRGIRALTADQPPAQLPDALLTGFFPLKFTPKVRQHAGGALAPRDTPTATPTWARTARTGTPGFPVMPGTPGTPWRPTGPGGPGTPSTPLVPLGPWMPFGPSSPRLPAWGHTQDSVGRRAAGPAAAAPRCSLSAGKGARARAVGRAGGPVLAPEASGPSGVCRGSPASHSPLLWVRRGHRDPARDKMRISATRVARAWAAAAADEAKARRPPSRAAPILRGAVWVTARTAHCAQAEEPLSPSKPDGAPRSEAPQPARPGRSGGFPGSRVKIVSGFATVHTCPRTRTPTGSRLGGFRVPQMRRKPEMQS